MFKLFKKEPTKTGFSDIHDDFLVNTPSYITNIHEKLVEEQDNKLIDIVKNRCKILDIPFPDSPTKESLFCFKRVIEENKHHLYYDSKEKGMIRIITIVYPENGFSVKRENDRFTSISSEIKYY